MKQATEATLAVKGLCTSFITKKGSFRAIDDVSFHIPKGKTLGIVGESGSGKSVTALSILRLIDEDNGRIEAGEVLLNGTQLLAMDIKEMRKVRGNRISMIFQEPMTSLNPIFTVGDQIGEVFRIHQGLTRSEAREKSIEMLHLVKIPAPEKRIDEYPYQLSGGMRQRIMIVMALACRPELLIADEPTTALDVTIQAQVLDLIAELQEQLSMSMLLITHDLGVVSEVCDEVVVMYGGRVVESATVEDLFTKPRHPYTKALLASIPKLGRRVERLQTIQGTVPSLGNFPLGCRFQNRCPFVQEQCRKADPVLAKCAPGHEVACFRWQELER